MFIFLFSLIFIYKVRTLEEGLNAISPSFEDGSKYTYLTAFRDGKILSKYSEMPKNKNSRNLVRLEKVRNKKNVYKIFFPKYKRILCRNSENRRVKACDEDRYPTYAEWKFNRVSDGGYQIKSKKRCLTEMGFSMRRSAFIVSLQSCNYTDNGGLKKPVNIWNVEKQNIHDDSPCKKNCEDADNTDEDSSFKSSDPINNQSTSNESETDSKKVKLSLEFNENPQTQKKENTFAQNQNYQGKDQHRPKEDQNTKKSLNKNNKNISSLGPTPEGQDIMPPNSTMRQGPSIILRFNKPLPFMGQENMPNLRSTPPTKNIPLYDHTKDKKPKSKCGDKITGKTDSYTPIAPFERALKEHEKKINGEDWFVERLNNQGVTIPPPVDMSRQPNKMNPQKDDSPACSVDNMACLFLDRQ